MAAEMPISNRTASIFQLSVSTPAAATHNSDVPIELHSSFDLLETGATSQSRADYNFPEGGLKAWLVVAGSFSVIAGCFGLMSSVGLFQAYWQEHQLSQYASRDVGWIPAVNIFLSLVLGVQVGPIFDRYGPRVLLAVGSLDYVVSLVLLAECKVYWHFVLVYGVLNGIGSAILSTTALSVIGHWFERRRGVASGVAFVGSSFGGILFPMMLRPMFQHYSWAWSIRLVALIVLLMMIVGNVCIRGRLPPRKNGGAVDLRSFRDARFSWTTLGVACFEFVLFGALGLLPTWGLGQGFSSQTTFNIIAVLNVGSAFGRSFSGYISDRYGRFNTMLLTVTFSIVVTFGLWIPIGNSIILFYVFAPLFGFGSGSIISMAPVCIGQLCQADEYGQFYGTSYSLVAFATFLCIPIGGELLPALGGTGFVASFGGILVLSMMCFLMARWACLEYKWKWRVKI